MIKNAIEPTNDLDNLLRRFPDPIWMMSPPAKSAPSDVSGIKPPARPSRPRPVRPMIVLMALGIISFALIPISFAVTNSASARYSNTTIRSVFPGPPTILQSSLLDEREPSRPRSSGKICEIAIKDLVQTTLTLKDALQLRRSIGMPATKQVSISLKKSQPRDNPPRHQPSEIKPQVEAVYAAPSTSNLSVMDNLIAFVTPTRL